MCDAAGQCQPPAPVPESFSFNAQFSVSGPRAGATETIASGAGSSISCSMDTATNFLNITLQEGTRELRMYVESDPITFCLFNTSAFNTFTFVDGSDSWGVDGLGNTRNLALSCQRRDNGMRLTGEFSSGRLFKGRNSSVFSGDHVTISGGTFSCDL